MATVAQMVGTRITLENLPEKFKPYLALDERQQPRPEGWNPTALSTAERLASFVPVIAAVRDVGLPHNVTRRAGLLIKGVRREPGPLGNVVPSTEDTHLYRVRKADKMRKLIEARGYGGDLVVARKTIWWDEQAEEMKVVAERLPLANTVAAFASTEVRTQYVEIGSTSTALAGTQIAALAEGAPEQVFTPRQAKALAECAFECGYTDMTYNNIFFHEDGRVAIIDTEPVKRRLKYESSGLFNKLLMDNRTMLVFMDSLTGTTKLKIFSTQEARHEIEQVEIDHSLYPMAITVGKLALTIIALCSLPFAIALLPVALTAIVPLLTFALTWILAIKVISYTVQGAIIGLGFALSQSDEVLVRNFVLIGEGYGLY